MDRPPLPQTPMASSWAMSLPTLVHPDGYFADLRSENGAFRWDIPASDVTRASSGTGLCSGVRHSTPASAKRARPQEPFLSRSEEHTSELPSLMRISYAVFCLKKKTNNYHLKTQ